MKLPALAWLGFAEVFVNRLRRELEALLTMDRARGGQHAVRRDALLGQSRHNDAGAQDRQAAFADPSQQIRFGAGAVPITAKRPV